MKSNKRLAKNTLLSYFQVSITVLVGVVSSRLLLQILGVSDFGLYNVVGGIVAIFAVISNSMTLTSTRFLSYEIGKGNGNANKEFNICNVLHMSMAFVVFFLLETIGSYYVSHLLIVEPGKENDALFLFHVSCLIACLSITNIPYKSLFVVHEDFLTLSVVEIVNSIVKLLAIIPLLLFDGNHLRLYALMVFVSTLFSFIVYHVMSIKRWPEITKWKLVKSFNSYKSQISYNNWTLVNTTSLAARSYGSDIIVNFFFGTVLNAAFAIARSVQTFAELLSQNFSKAAFPIVVKNLGENKINEALNIIYFIGRVNMLLLEFSFFCMYVELDFLLHLWLGSHVPYGTLVFCKCILWIALLAGTGGGLYQYIRASGRLKEYNSITAFFYLMSLPISFVLYKNGYPYYSILVVFGCMEILCRISQIVMMKKNLGFDVIKFVKESWAGPLLVFIVLCLYLLIYKRIIIDFSYKHVFGIITTSLFSIVTIWFAGLKANERLYISKKISSHIKM